MLAFPAPLDISPDLVSDIQLLVSRELASAGVREADITVRSGEDHDGDPAIMVDIQYDREAQAFDGRAAARALFTLNSMLRRRGETRFAYILHREEASA